MNITDQYKHAWKIIYKRGEGTATVYANSANEANIAALAAYRKKKAEMDFCTIDQIVESATLIA